LLAIILQRQIAYVNSIARLATIGPNPINPALPNPDVDSFVNAYNVFRIEATAATGQVVFSVASSPALPILIPAVPSGSSTGVIVQTTTGIKFVVIADTTNANYNATLNAYVIATGTTSVSVTVQCLSLGVNGNVAADQITQLFSGPGTTSIAGITGINNPNSFANAPGSAVNLETDAALKVRFAFLMVTGSVGTPAAFAAAILASAVGLTFSVGDQLNSSGVTTSGVGTIVVNNAGTGTAPPSTLVPAVQAAINGVRALGITATVIAPTILAVNAVANIQIAPGFLPSAVIAACSAAYTALVNNIGLNPTGGSTSAKIAAMYATLFTTPGVLDVTSLTLNGAAADVVAPFATQLVAGTVSFTPFS
jgi:hypothetical protein